MKAQSKPSRRAPPARVAETPIAPQPPAFVLFGRDGAGRPRAAWFDAADAEAATAAAAPMRLRALPVANDAGRALAEQLARGRMLPSGRANVPFAKHELYGRLVELAGEEAGLSVAKDVETEASSVSNTVSMDTPSQGDEPTLKSDVSASTKDHGRPRSEQAASPAASEPAAEPPSPRPSDGTFVGQPNPQDRSEIGLGSIVLAHEGPEEGWWEAEVIGCNGRSFSLRWRDYPSQPTILRKASELALLPPGEP